MSAWSPADLARVKALAPQGIGALRRAFPGRSRHSLQSAARRAGARIPRTYDVTEYRRGKIPTPKHCHPLVRDIIAECNRQRVYLYEVAERAGFSRQAFSKWRYATTPHLQLLIAAANVLGLELALRPMREPGEHP